MISFHFLGSLQDHAKFIRRTKQGLVSGPSTAIDVLRKDFAYNRFPKEVGSCGITSYVIAARWIWLWNNGS